MTRRAALLGLAALGVAPVHAHAQLDRTERQKRRLLRRQARQQQIDTEAIREAVKRGEIEPLRDLMQYFENQTGVEIIDVRHRFIAGQHFYGFKVRTPRGRLRWAVINAATREIMTMREARRRYGQ